MFKNRGKKLVVVLKSSSVELSVVDFSNKPTLLFATKETLLYKTVLTPETFLTNSTNALLRLLKNNKLKIAASINGSRQCEIIFHSPWFFPELISEENKGKMISLKEFFKEKVRPPEQDTYMQIENKITNILLNGYNLTKIRDVKSDDININIYRSFVNKKSIDKITKIIKDGLGNMESIEYSSSAMQFYETIKDIFTHEENYMFFSVGGEVTEVGIVENDILESYYTIPIGSHKFSRELDTFITESGNLNTLRFLGDEVTDEKLDKIKKDRINQIKNEWASEIMNTIKEDGKELPHKVFLISNSDSLKFFNIIVKECEICSDLNFYSINKEVFQDKVEILENKELKNNVEYLLSAYYLSIKN